MIIHGDMDAVCLRSLNLVAVISSLLSPPKVLSRNRSVIYVWKSSLHLFGILYKVFKHSLHLPQVNERIILNPEKSHPSTKAMLNT